MRSDRRYQMCRGRSCPTEATQDPRTRVSSCTCRLAMLQWRVTHLCDRKYDLAQYATRLGLSRGDRGRLGKALLGMLGLKEHDSSPLPDAGDIEIKWVRLKPAWRHWGEKDDCYVAKAIDKVFVCAEGQDPMVKLKKVLWVYGDDSNRLLGSWPYVYDPEDELEKKLFLNTKSEGRSWYLRPNFMLESQWLRKSVSALIPGGSVSAQHWTIRDHLGWYPEFYQ